MIDKELRNQIASNKMETGYELSNDEIELIRKYVNGEIEKEDLIAEICGKERKV